MEDVWTALTPVLVNFALIVIPVLAAYLVVILKKAIKDNTDAVKIEAFYKQVEFFIQSLAQQGIIVDWSGADKKGMAMTAMTELRDKLSLDITDDQIDHAIEAYVLALQDAQLILGPPG